MRLRQAPGKKMGTPPRRGPGKKYLEYMDSREWIEKKQEYWDSEGYSCKVPGCEVESRLEVHHWTYSRLGNEDIRDLVGVCKRHHQEIHQVRDEKGLTLRAATQLVTGVKYKTVKKQRPRYKVKKGKVRLTALAKRHLKHPPLTPCRCYTCDQRKKSLK